MPDDRYKNIFHPSKMKYLQKWMKFLWKYVKCLFCFSENAEYNSSLIWLTLSLGSSSVIFRKSAKAVTRAVFSVKFSVG